MKIIITGGSGLLGQYLNIFLSRNFDILSIFNSKQGNSTQFNSVQLDITDKPRLKDVFDSYKPDVVIHTAAISSPNAAQMLPPKYVYDVNVNATKYIAELCDSLNACLFYTSTDLVYAGYRGSMLKEDSKVIPISLYAETKLMGEEKIKSTFGNYLILRTALLFGIGLFGSSSFFDLMYKNLKENQRVRLFTDQYRTPLSVMEAAKAIGLLIQLKVKGEVVNFGGINRVSRAELGDLLCEEAGSNKDLIDKISMKEIDGFPAVEDVSMNTDKLQSYGIKVKDIKESLIDVLNFEKEKM